MKPVHKKGVLIAVVFGIISVIILTYLKVQGVFLIIMIWILVPVMIKLFINKIKNLRK